MKNFKRITALVLSLIMVISAGILTAQAVNTTAVSTEADTETGITVYFKCEDTQPYIYYWNSLPTNLEIEYPGAKMTSAPAQGENWYQYTFDDITKINILFTDKDGNQLSDELTRNTGEWWYKNKLWRSSNPEQADDAEDIDFREETIYFVIPTRFYDGDTSNNVHCWDDGTANNPDSDPAWRGDFKGLAEKLDYIKALGFSAIWITPVVENASGYDYHGYHAMNFMKVDSRYESDDFTYDDLIEAVHNKGMKIIQDVVWNHTGNFGESQLCELFTKDYSADLSNLQESMIPTQTLLDAFGLNSAEEYWAQTGSVQYQQRLNLMKNTTYSGSNGNTTGTYPDSADYSSDKVSTSSLYNSNNYWHSGYFQSLNWDDWTCKFAQIAGDCVDLNTENPAVAEYTTQAYASYIARGVDAFRVDTVRHIPRLTLNMMYNQQIHNYAADSGNNNFFMFGEVCCRFSEAWYRGHAQESSMFYTWKESSDEWANKWSWGTDAESINNNMNLTLDHYIQYDDTSSQPTSNNAFLNGLAYHEADYSDFSGMNTIDFGMHWNFDSASRAFNAAKSEDKYFNDSTWNVVYVQSHDYSPDSCQNVGYTGGTQAWAENLNLMFTFRGIPCLYYGNEVEFQKGQSIDVGTTAPLSTTCRAYYGDYLEGTVSANDFSEYSATGTVADTLNSTLSQHIMKLNAVRRAIPALQKGQYTVDSTYVSGDMAYIRRYTDANEGVDSLALVTVSGGATFKNIPNGKYIDAITGETKTVTNGTLTVSSIGTANARVYVCCADGFTGIDGAIGKTGLTYLK